MSEDEVTLPVRDVATVERVLPLLNLVLKHWFRSEVTGLEHVPEGGALLVSNHSGGLTPMDVPILFVAFAEQLGPERELYTLAHDGLFKAPGLGAILQQCGFVPANRANAAAALATGGVTIVFPGGDWDAYRPTRLGATVDFGGRKGYVRTALAAGVPIVPVVSIGGQDAQLFLHRSTAAARLLRLDRLVRLSHIPVSIGFPFGLTVGPLPNLPLPTKITTRVLEPIEPSALGDDIDEIDTEVRRRMQVALDEMAAARRFPVLG